MSKWKNHLEYWSELKPLISDYVAKKSNPDVSNVLAISEAFFGFVSERIGSKITTNKAMSPNLDLFLVYGFDQLRAAPHFYETFNLAPTAISARATFENCVSQRYIVQSKDPSKFANLYHRFKSILILKAHRNSKNLTPLSPERELEILNENPEWVDPATKKLIKKPHWTAIKGMNFEQLVTDVGMKDYYSLYRTTSQFVHASPITINLYKSPLSGFGPIPEEIQARRMCLLIAMFSLETLIDYCKFFGVPYDNKEYYLITKELNRLT